MESNNMKEFKIMKRGLLFRVMFLILVAAFASIIVTSLMASPPISEDAIVIEYKVIDTVGKKKLEALLNTYGREGWELVDLVSGVIIFKRKAKETM